MAAAIAKALESAGNGGVFAGSIRLISFVMMVSFTVTGYLILDKVDQFESALANFDLLTRENSKSTTLNSAAIVVLKGSTSERWRRSEAIPRWEALALDWEAQHRVDEAQNEAHQRLQDRVDREHSGD